MDEQGTFTIILRWDEEQQVYLGTVPDIVGLEGTGSTYEEALASALEAIRWWQEMSRGRPHPPPAEHNATS